MSETESRERAELMQKQIDAEQAWEFLLSKSVPNLDIERTGKHKVTLTELLVEFANGRVMAECEAAVQATRGRIAKGIREESHKRLVGLKYISSLRELADAIEKGEIG